MTPTPNPKQQAISAFFGGSNSTAQARIDTEFKFTAEGFAELQKQVIKTTCDRIHCPTCGTRGVENRGPAGNANAVSVQGVSVRCKAQECKVSTKLQLALAHPRNTHLAAYSQQLDEYDSGLRHTSKKRKLSTIITSQPNSRSPISMSRAGSSSSKQQQYVTAADVDAIIARAMDTQRNETQSEFEQLRREIHNMQQLLQQKDADNRALRLELDAMIAENAELRKIQVNRPAPQIVNPPTASATAPPRNPRPAPRTQWIEVGRQKPHDENMVRIATPSRTRGGAPRTRIVDTGAMSFAQKAALAQQTARKLAIETGDFSAMKGILDAAKERRKRGVNSDAPRMGRDGQPLVRTDRMVRFKVCMFWVDRSTAAPLQFARQGLRSYGFPWIEEISFLGVGNTWAEWFVDEKLAAEVRTKLQEHEFEFEEGFKPMEPPRHRTNVQTVDVERSVIRRRGRIWANARFPAMRNAAMDGVPENLHGAIREYGNRYLENRPGWKWPRPVTARVSASDLEQETEMMMDAEDGEVGRSFQ